MERNKVHSSGCTQELISVIMPVYNVKNDLAKSVKSVLRQTYHKLEIILVDDGSTDGSGELCDNFALTDSRIVVIHKQNGGISSARNMGIQRSNGKYITFLDSDDFLHPQAIERLYCALKERGCDISYCKFSVISHDENIVYRNADRKTVCYMAEQRIVYILKKGGYECSSCGILFSADLLKNNMKQFCLDVSFCEDLYFVIDILYLYGNTIVLASATPLYYYVQRDDSAIHTLSPTHLHDSLSAAKMVLRRCRKTNVQKAAVSQLVSAAFFAYLRSGSGNEYDRIRDESMAIILKYRKAVLLNSGYSMKTKAASFLSLFSMSWVKAVYRFVKGI